MCQPACRTAVALCQRELLHLHRSARPLDRDGLAQITFDGLHFRIDVRQTDESDLPGGLHILRLLNKDAIGVLEQGTFHEEQSAVVLEAMDQDDVSSIDVVAGLAPLQFFVESSSEAQLAKRSKLRSPPPFTGVDLADEWVHIALTIGCVQRVREAGPCRRQARRRHK